MRLARNRSRPSKQPPEVDSRKILSAPITVLKAGNGSGARVFFGYAKNISRSGMMIGATNPREVGSRFRLEIPFPEPLEIVATCTCEVVWCRRWAKGDTREPGMGLRFLDLPEGVASAIDDWIESETLYRQLWN